MRKTITGVGLLIIILSAILANNLILDRTLNKLCEHISFADEKVQANDFKAAEMHLEDALDYWKAMEGYYQAFLRHNETDSALHEIMEAKFLVTSGFSADFEIIYEKLEEISAMEKISLKSIF